jgi:hypothetical protein
VQIEKKWYRRERSKWEVGVGTGERERALSNLVWICLVKLGYYILLVELGYVM